MMQHLLLGGHYINTKLSIFNNTVKTKALYVQKTKETPQLLAMASSSLKHDCELSKGMSFYMTQLIRIRHICCLR